VSTSERIEQLANDIDALNDEMGQMYLPDGTADVAVTHLLRAAVVTFARAISAPQGAHTLEALGEATTTDACTAAAALLRSQDLTPFEFSVWMQATAAPSTL
jgi:hypothetical protein